MIRTCHVLITTAGARIGDGRTAAGLMLGAIPEGPAVCLRVGFRSRLETEVEDGQLIIGSSGSWLDKLGDVNIESLDAERLEGDLPGAGKISVASQVAEQTVTVSGAGSYDAPKLESQKAKAALGGLGSAIVCAVEELDATIRGLGSVSYYGTPSVRQDISGAGSVKGLGMPCAFTG